MSRLSPALILLTSALLTGCAVAPSAAPPPAAAGFPVQVPDCTGKVTPFDEPARKIVTSNAAGLEILLWLGAQELVVGTGFPPGKGDLPPELAAAAAKVPSFGGDATGGAMRGISREQLLGSGADTYVEAWGALAGMDDVATPEQLARVGIRKVLLRSTACAPAMNGPQTDLSVLQADIARLGAITGRATEAERVLDGMNTTLAEVERAVAGAARPSVFFFDYDAGTDAPMTPCNRQVANAVYTLAGARNVFDDCADDFKKVGWEEVVERDPDWIQLGVRGRGDTAADARAFDEAAEFLSTFAATRDLRAVKAGRFLRIRSEVTTIGGVRNADTVRSIAAAIHPGRIKAAG
ncbi:ABC transporter substrate-binding protein [Nonomuraea longicatena]|uniref:ABC transporter substrate-binding protein n=1 Tax=Nonomuraea longicatena TaxID=83682 RepID=A0ABN1R895_9ACTN